jgi:hypothetical protein
MIVFLLAVIAVMATYAVAPALGLILAAGLLACLALWLVVGLPGKALGAYLKRRSSKPKW